MDQLKTMKEQLVSQVQAQMGNLAAVDAKELGEVVDMIKDLEEAIYYCTIVDAMKEKEKDPQHLMYYTPYYPKSPYDDMMYNVYRDMDRDYGKMYYTDGGRAQGGGNMNGNNSGRTAYYREPEDIYPMKIHDFREGRSPMSRKNYMESKEMHKDKNTQMQELEKYMRELSQDLTEMIQDASPEEKQLLHQKILTLAEKI